MAGKDAIVRFVFFVLALGAFSCDRITIREEPAERIVARAGDEQLSFVDYSTSYSGILDAGDSAGVARKSIESWAKDALFYQEALNNLESDELDVERRVEEYRRSLINYIYQSRLIENNLDTVVSAEEIQAYYDENRGNFILKENIVKVDYIKVPALAPGLEKIKKLIGSNREKDKEQLITLCLQNAENFFVNDSSWLFVEDIRKEIPQMSGEDDYRLVPGKVFEFNDEQYYYYLKIRDIKIKDALSPLYFEWANIRKYILNNRKTRLINEYKLSLLEDARAKKRFVMY